MKLTFVMILIVWWLCIFIQSLT